LDIIRKKYKFKYFDDIDNNKIIKLFYDDINSNRAYCGTYEFLFEYYSIKNINTFTNNDIITILKCDLQFNIHKLSVKKLYSDEMIITYHEYIKKQSKMIVEYETLNSDIDMVNIIICL
jgi:hypothetical protein